ncbi:MAG TPA: Fe-S cluster assembly protein IscX [Pseudomonadales bacterium]|jgi:FeS assembly protein IscX|nr:Fe-S cluster assembly protein IscX [Pseudomonadales bacterium]HNN87615.1 Fe-S cluster assembly protein IscX [Pseudomonadales bacterium]
MKWTDVQHIAMELVESKPDVDPRYVNFVDLRNWVMALPGFDDVPERCGEKILEAIQAAWIDEQD